MNKIEFDINIKKEGTLKETFELFKDEPVIGWLLKHRIADVEPMNFITEAIYALNISKMLDIPYVDNGGIVCISRDYKSSIMFTPTAATQVWGIGVDTPGVMELNITCYVNLSDKGEIVSIESSVMLERVLVNLKERVNIDDPKWSSSITYQNVRTLSGVSSDIVKLIITNLVEGAVSMDPRGNYPAIAYLLLGYKCKYLASDYITESVIRAQRTGLISSDPKIFME